jgi:hypothetical protein
MSSSGNILSSIKITQSGGAPLPERSTINFTGSGVTVSDDPTHLTTDINITCSGCLSPSQGTVTLKNGLNSGILTGDHLTLRLIGPSAAFSIGGFSPTTGAPAAGSLLKVVNLTSQPMTIVPNDSHSRYPIDTLSGVPLTLPPRQTSAAFFFDGVTGKWVLEHAGFSYESEYDVRDFGAKCDGIEVSDGAISSGSHVLACTTSKPFQPNDVGKLITVRGAGASPNANLNTTIATFIDSGHVSLAAAAGTTVATRAVVRFGSDDFAALNAAIDFIDASGTAKTLNFPVGIVCLSGGIAFLDGEGIIFKGNLPSLNPPTGITAGTRILLMNYVETLWEHGSVWCRYEHLWFDGGGNATVATMKVVYPTWQCVWDHVVYSGAQTNADRGTAYLVSFDGAIQLEVDNCRWLDCGFFQNPIDSAEKCRGAILNANQQAFQNEFRCVHVFGCTYGQVCSVAVQSWYQYQAFVDTAIILQTAPCFPGILEDGYSEQTVAQLIQQDLVVGEGGPSQPIIFRKFVGNSAAPNGNGATVQCFQPIVFEDCQFSFNVYIQPDATYGRCRVQARDTVFVVGDFVESQPGFLDQVDTQYGVDVGYSFTKILGIGGLLNQTGYDSSGLTLAHAKAWSATPSGNRSTTIFADDHFINVLTADRSYTLTSVFPSNGSSMRITNASMNGHAVTINAFGATIPNNVILQPGHWVEVEWGVNGWIVIAGWFPQYRQFINNSSLGSVTNGAINFTDNSAYLSATGRLHVSVRVNCNITAGSGTFSINGVILLDGSAIASTVGVPTSVLATNGSVVQVYADYIATVTPFSAHKWGMQVACGAGVTMQVNANSAQLILEDI